MQLRDEFWQPRREINRDVTLESQWQQCVQNGYIRNFERLAGGPDVPFEGLHWNDSDVYKWLEAASWAMATPDCPSSIREHVDTVAGLIERAQDADGYLHTYFQGAHAGERYQWLEQSHELYAFGHFIQAAIAHFRATRSLQLLNVACRLADHLDATFGPEKDGKRETTDGHEEIEMALIELSRTVEDAQSSRKYLELARFFVAVRGPGKPVPIAHLDHHGQKYHQSHAPLVEQREAVGHAVRAMYLYCGATDLLLEADDAELEAALQALWINTTRRKMYVTGGVGSRHDGESFGADFELPNDSAYCETCAAIGLVMWAHRMLLKTGRGEFADVLERALYNNVLAGLSLDGRQYFYVNPLESDGQHRRQGWFGCACCPPNIARLMSQLPAYFASLDSSSNIWLHLYASGEIKISASQRELSLHIETRYPWDGKIEITVQGEGEFALMLRAPAWCDKYVLRLDGEEIEAQVLDGTIRVQRAWKRGDCVQLDLEMPARRVEANPGVEANLNRVALMRGPLVYCLEEADHEGIDIFELALTDDAPLQSTEQNHTLPISAVVLRTQAERALAQGGWEGELYRAATQGRGLSVDATAIPYFAWANRTPGKMRVWIPRLAG